MIEDIIVPAPMYEHEKFQIEYRNMKLEKIFDIREYLKIAYNMSKSEHWDESRAQELIMNLADIYYQAYLLDR